MLPRITPAEVAVQSFVYASQRKTGGYLWLAQRDAFGRLPKSLTELLGELRFVMAVELDATRKLPVEDVAQVLEHLHTQGWHLQLPPKENLALANHPGYGTPMQDADAP